MILSTCCCVKKNAGLSSDFAILAKLLPLSDGSIEWRLAACPVGACSQNAARGYDPWRAASWTLCVRSEPLVLQITDVIDADDVACIADRFIASDVRLAQDVRLLRNSRDGFTLWVENGAYRPRPVILLNVRCHADELVAALNKYRGRSTHFLLDLVNQHEVVIHLCRAKM